MNTRRGSSKGTVLCEFAGDAVTRPRSGRFVGAHPSGTEWPQGLLELRIDLHMKMVRRALDRIRELNPKGTIRDELPEEAWYSLAWRGERALLDIVDAEVRFWADLIEGNPKFRLGDGETAWVTRVVRLASIIRESEDRRREELAFLGDRFS